MVLIGRPSSDCSFGHRHVIQKCPYHLETADRVSFVVSVLVVSYPATTAVVWVYFGKLLAAKEQKVKKAPKKKKNGGEAEKKPSEAASGKK